MCKSRFSEEQIVGIIQEYAAGAKVNELCRRFGMSDATFYKWKAKYGGMQVNEVKQMLETQKDAVDKVGRRAGYEDTSSFRRIFKRKVGLTPGIYRRKFGRGRFEKFVNLV